MFKVQWGWIGCVLCEKFRHDFVVWTFAIIAPVQPVLHQISCSNEWSQMHPNTTKYTQTRVQGPVGWIECVRCEKLLHDFVTQIFALISPFQPILHQASSNNETIPNARKHYKTHQNISLRSNGMNRVCSLRIIPPRLLGTNYCIICTSLACFAQSFTQ